MADVYEFVTEQTAKILELTKDEASDLYEGTDFVMELGVDHYDMERIVLQCKENFNIDITDKEIDQISNVKSLVELVNGKIKD